jgi:hypothetical protein
MTRRKDSIWQVGDTISSSQNAMDVTGNDPQVATVE